MPAETIEVLQNVNILSTLVRLLLALVLGGVLGLERGRKHRPAGFRTYMIVCMASALVMMTGEYILQAYGTGDPARLGAQVISGIGFLGAGTIMITSRKVRGLTTAAGLWAAACMGLAVGAGYYIGAIVCGILVLLIMTLMTYIEARVGRKSKQLNLFVEFASMESVGNFVNILREEGYRVYDMEINRGTETIADLVGVTFWVGITQTPVDRAAVIEHLTQIQGVRYLEELENM